MNGIRIHKADSSEATDKFAAEYYKRLSSELRVETLQLLRGRHFKSDGLKFGEDGKRLRRVLSVIKQT